MNVTQDLSLINLIGNASLVVKLVIALMLGMSLMSWWFIFRKAFVVRRVKVIDDSRKSQANKPARSASCAIGGIGIRPSSGMPTSAAFNSIDTIT